MQMGEKLLKRYGVLFWSDGNLELGVVIVHTVDELKATALYPSEWLFHVL